MLQIRWFRAMPSIRSVDLAPGAVPVHHKHTKRQLTTSTSPWKPKLGRAGGKHQVHGLADVSEAAVTLTLPDLAHEELPPSGITEHKC